MSEKKLDLIAQPLAKAERTTPEEAEAGILYRVNGGEPVAAADMAWGTVFPWDTVERKGPGSPWSPCPPDPPVFLKTSPDHHPGPDGRYHLKGPIWPPRR